MRSKAPLALIEQLIMVLVFALAAVLCLQGFVLSDQASRHNEARDQAVLEAQNAAEALKAGSEAYFEERHAGPNGNTGYTIAYDSNWQIVEPGSGDEVYVLVTASEKANEYLRRGTIVVYGADGEDLFRLPVAWQEVSHE